MSRRPITPIERVGMKYGKLTITKFLRTDEEGNSLYSCVCECGSEGRYTLNCLRERGANADCGCSHIVRRGERRNDIASPWEDCRSYMPAKHNCSALKELLCATKGECSFYKGRGVSC